MRTVIGFLVIVGLAVTTATFAQGPSPDATKILRAAREALGGEKRLSDVKTFVATGRTRQVRGENLVPIEFEIACELPGRYVRKDEIPAQESEPTSTGFNGDDLIQLPPPPEPAVLAARAGASGSAVPNMPTTPGRGAGAPPGAQLEAARKTRLTTAKQDFARLMLGMFATSFASYPLTFTYGGQAEAPQGKADIVDAKGPGNFAIRFFINRQTHLPIMVSWGVAPNVVVRAAGQPAPASLPPGAVVVEAPPPPDGSAGQEEREKYVKDLAEIRKKAQTQAKPVEHRVYFADYRDVEGMQFPFRIRRAIGADTIEETTFDRFRINVKIDPTKFEVRK